MKRVSLFKLAKWSQILACLGVIPAVWGFFRAAEESRREEQKTQALLRLTAFPALDGVIQRDREERSNLQDAVAGLKNMANQEALAATYRTGEEAYIGTKGLASAGRHYEYLGVMIRLGYVEFEPIFEVVSFPDALWDAAVESGFLKMAREENWRGPGKPMPDFWVNFEYLRTCYHLAREGKPIPGAARKDGGETFFDKMSGLAK
jgi:hypothetical protein